MSKKINKQQKAESNETVLVKAQLVRALADYDNLKKRVDKERIELIRYANTQFITRLLPILDMLYQAQSHLQDSGLAITIKEFENLLLEEGLEKINSQAGVKFDEHLHEAVESIDGGESGTVSEETLGGWKYKDGPVVRHSKVKVYRKI